jgi:hypothetical protein
MDPVPVDKDIARYDVWLYYLFTRGAPLLILVLLIALLLWLLFKWQKGRNKAEGIYIPLVNEGSPVVRPTWGTKVGGNAYRVLPTKDYDPATEEWEFLPGSIVACAVEIRNSRAILVAKKKLTSESPLP